MPDDDEQVSKRNDWDVAIVLVVLLLVILGWHLADLLLSRPC